MASGDDIVSGAITAAERTTDLIAQIPSEGNVNFDGDIIFRVGPQQGGETRPSQTLHGIVGIGWNGSVVQGSQGGTGVTGIGGPNQGTGIVGKGGGDNRGSGGIGVLGVGGSAIGPEFAPVDPGRGVLGQGGVQDDFETTGLPHGAGIVGVAGDAPLPSFIESGSVGVFGRGGNAHRKTVTVEGEKVLAGPKESGPGVLGKGGIQTADGKDAGTPSAGVIGLAGGEAPPEFFETSNVGTYGKGLIGVKGRSESGTGGRFESKTATGVVGHSDGGIGGLLSSTAGVGLEAITSASGQRAGIFLSKSAAQVQLVPHKLDQEILERVTSPPKALFTKGHLKALPAKALAGDLFCTIMQAKPDPPRPPPLPAPEAVLWLCVIDGDDNPNQAQWRQVLLGPKTFGQNSLA